MKTARFTVSGMSCGHCVHAVKEALGAVPGVKVEEVRVGSAAVAYDETRTTIGDIVDAVADAGYEAVEAA